MKKVLVLGSVSRTILAAIRSLGRGGVQVHLAWNEPGCVSLRSRYLRAAHTLPPYHENDDGWKTGLTELMHRECFDLVLPCSDVDTLACQRHRADLERWGRVYTPNDEAAAVLFDKIKTNELARAVGVCTPREIVVTTADSLEPVLAAFDFPVVLKPRRTFDPARPGPAPKVQKAYSERELRDLLPGMLEGGPVAVQENFIGHGAGVELLLNAGEPLLAFQHARVHEPLQGGQSCYRKSEALSPELLEASLRLLRPLKYTGVAMVEFKVNPATGRWVFIEVNARFWGSLPLSVAAGADFPLALYRLLVEGRTEFPPQYRQGIYCRNLSLDLEWQLANLLADHRDPTLLTMPLWRVFGEACLDVLTLRGRSDTWAVDDPGPAFAEVGQLVRRAWGRLRKAHRGDGAGRHGSDRRSGTMSAPASSRAARGTAGLAPPNLPKRPNLSVVEVKDWDQLAGYVAAWEDLAAAALEPNVFYEPWMLLPALRAFGSGGDLRVLLVVEETPRRPGAGPLLCGVFPLEGRRHYRGLPVRVLGLWKYIHCYLTTPLLRAEYGAECWQTLLRWLATDRGGAALLEMPWVSGDGPFQQLLVEHLEVYENPVHVSECFTRAVLRPAADSDSYLRAVLPGWKRKKLRKQEERLAAAGAVDYAALEPDGDVRTWLDEFLRLEACGWKGRAGTALGQSEADRRFFEEVAGEAFRRGRLMMLALRLDCRPIAQLCNFLAGDGAFAFKVAYDEAHAAHSPGVLLELENIRRVHARPGIRWMDSCTAPGPALVKSLWAERRVLQTLVLATGRRPGGLVVSSLPALRWLRRAAGSLGGRVRGLWKRTSRGPS